MKRPGVRRLMGLDLPRPSAIEAELLSALVLVGMAAVAGLAPTTRALRVDPAISMRAD